jgi:hypothetical protein
MDLNRVRSEIEHMRVQVGRQCKEILQLQRAGIGSAAAELLLQRMLAKTEGRAGPAQEGAGRSNERTRAWRPELAMPEQLKWYDDKAANSPWLEALAELRQRAAREGHCYQHVQAITVAIDQYAEKALGNRDYFLNKPYGVG